MEKEERRIHQDKGQFGKVATKEPDFPNLTAMQAFDRQQHIQKAMEMGMSREEAERHADDDLRDRDDAGGTPPAQGGEL